MAGRLDCWRQILFPPAAERQALWHRLPRRIAAPTTHNNSQAKADAEALCEERCQLALQQQALKYERRIGELEAAACGGYGWLMCAGW